MQNKMIRIFTEGTAVLFGVLALILSFITAFVGVSYDGEIEGLDLSSLGISAWHSYATLGMLLVIAATILATIKLVGGDSLNKTVGIVLLASAAFLALIGTALLALRAFTVGEDGGGIDVGIGWSGVALLVVGVGLVAALAIAVWLVVLQPATRPVDIATVSSEVPSGSAASYAVENPKALWAMILGIVSFACAAPITSIIAIVLGLQAQREIAASAGMQTGESKAKAGLILGIVSAALSLLGIVLFVVLISVGAYSS